MNVAPDDRLQDLEIKFAYLERHVSEQDRAMLALAERLDRLEARCEVLQRGLAFSPDGASPPRPADERPPHY